MAIAGTKLAAPMAVSSNLHSGILRVFPRNLGKSLNLCHLGLLGSLRGVVIKPNGAVSQWILVALFV